MPQGNANELAEPEVEDLLEDFEVAPAPLLYSISSYGADYDVRGLVQRLNEGDIEIPPFQRGYVWSPEQASRFIESLLLGLPVPGIFLSKEGHSQKLLVIDGQQRLVTLQRFYRGMWDDVRRTPFLLHHVQPQFERKSYATLLEPDRRRLDNSIIHATIIKQDAPTGENSSIYQIFQRLNSGGTDLEAQEIRSALNQGPLNDLLRELNENVDWRRAFGSISRRMKDQEMILRFLAMAFDAASYGRPMEEFLNTFMGRNRDLQRLSRETLVAAFVPTIRVAVTNFTDRAFKPRRAFNAAVFDSVMVGLYRRLAKGAINDLAALKEKYGSLLADPNYLATILKSTADERNVARRLELATAAFTDVA